MNLLESVQVHLRDFLVSKFNMGVDWTSVLWLVLVIVLILGLSILFAFVLRRMTKP